jgi:ubiquinone/menaquinone biosynthesis C-methylase UbiE/GNAT superfamily N-acetyltransferase
MTQLSSANSAVIEETYVFYALTLPDRASSSTELAASGYRCVTWTPGLHRVVPAALLRHQHRDSPIRFRHLVYFWIHHYLSLFRTRREYLILLVLRGEELAHYSLVRSRDFRFPFMGAGDIQVGPVWTHPNHRGRGLASYALAMIRARWADTHCRLWWVCSRDNTPSNRVATRQGLSIVGQGFRRKKLGLRLFGRFCIERSPSGGRAPDFTIITETPGAGATRDQLSILYTRYDFASRWVKGKDVLEVACGAGVGLGFLAREAAHVTGGDIEDANWRLAAETYQRHPRIRIQQFDAHNMPFSDGSFDVVVVFEAIYYLSDPGLFLREVQRVLRPGGVLLMSSVNSEWPGFHPSAYSQNYYGSRELGELLTRNDFEPALYAAFPDHSEGIVSAIVQRVRRAAVNLHLIPRTMKGKNLLKRMFYGRLTPIPREITEGMACLEPLSEVTNVQDVTSYKMIYAVGSKRIGSTP